MVEPALVEGIAASAGRQLLVGGLRDELWVSAIAHELGGSGCDVLEVPDADHSMGTGDGFSTLD